tara:strand:+ start:199 stop:492 length:294 start_codon:yes stop_codon:yes gene_type:complete
MCPSRFPLASLRWVSGLMVFTIEWNLGISSIIASIFGATDLRVFRQVKEGEVADVRLCDGAVRQHTCSGLKNRAAFMRASCAPRLPFIDFSKVGDGG